jgi:nickel/cobalt transporter (NicO) family protein
MQKTLILIFLLFSISFSFVQSEASPFSSSDRNEKSERVSSPSATSIIWFKFLKTQRDLNQKITHYLNEVKKGESSFIVWLVFAFAFLYGILHSIGPGHGKLIILSYFTAHEAKWPSAIIMGFQIAFIHGLSAIVLVLSVKNIAKYILMSSASQEMLILTLISYGAIMLVGVFLLRETYKSSKKQVVENIKGTEKFNKSQWLLALSIGLIPCTGALLILFYAMAKQMLFIGIVSVFFMTLGMAVTLSTIGSVYIMARRKISYFTVSKKRSKSILALHYMGASLIALMGSVLFIRALKIAF